MLRPVNEWLYPEGNRLTASVNWPPGESYQPGVGKLQARLFRGDPQAEVPEPGEVLGELSWPPPERPETYPHSLAVAVDVSDPPPTRLWREAEPIEVLTPADRAEMLAQAEALQQAVLAGRGADAYRLSGYKFADDVRANGLDPATLQQAVTGQYEQLAKDLAPARSEPLTADLAVYTLVGDGRLVQLTRGTEEYAFAVVGAELGAMYELFFANLGGRWRIAR